MQRTTAVAALAALTLAAAACGGDDDAAPRAAAAGPQRYCALVDELDRRGEVAFAEAKRPAEFVAIERGFVAGIADDTAELERVAPVRIRGDVRTMVSAMRGRAGLADVKVPQREASAAEKRVKAFEKTAC
jgi:hypothetical protein